MVDYKVPVAFFLVFNKFSQRQRINEAIIELLYLFSSFQQRFQVAQHAGTLLVVGVTQVGVPGSPAVLHQALVSSERDGLPVCNVTTNMS